MCIYFFIIYEYAFTYMLPLDSGTNFQYTKPYSIRPDSTYTDGQYDGANSNGNYDCFEASCWHFEFNGQISAAVTFDEINHNRDLMITWRGLSAGLFNWNADINGIFFPDEYADMLNDSVDPDDDCGAPNAGTPNPQCMFNDTADLDDDFDGIYDHWDMDDDNDGIWDFFEVDVNDDLDDDANTLPPGNFFTGTNCFDNDDDGTDTDPDEDGFYQAVWDKGVLGQGLLFPEYYDVDNDNDGEPDGDWDTNIIPHQVTSCAICPDYTPRDFPLALNMDNNSTVFTFSNVVNLNLSRIQIATQPTLYSVQVKRAELVRFQAISKGTAVPGANILLSLIHI